MTTRSRHDRGYALLELLAVITVTVLLLSLCAAMIHSLLKLDRSGRAALEEATDMPRLADDFRSDIHQADAESVISPRLDKLTLTFGPARSVEYQVRDVDILRTLKEGAKVRHAETYRRPDRTSTRFERLEEGSRRFVTIHWTREAVNPHGSLYQDYKIEAELGRDRRLTLRGQ